jgi:hypothetical protein
MPFGKDLLEQISSSILKASTLEKAIIYRSSRAWVSSLPALRIPEDYAKTGVKDLIAKRKIAEG